MTEFVSIKITKRAFAKLRELKAILILRTGRLMSDAQVIAEAIDFALENEEQFIASLR